MPSAFISKFILQMVIPYFFIAQNKFALPLAILTDCPALLNKLDKAYNLLIHFLQLSAHPAESSILT